MIVLTSFTYPNSPIRYEERNTRVVLDKKDLGVGTLYISEKSVSWKSQEISECGFSLSYHHISLHAISSDPTLYPKECIYIMIDTHITIPGGKEEEGNDDVDSDLESEPDLSELILVPNDPNVLQLIYETMKDCQTLNPDIDGLMSDEDDVYEDADEIQEMPIEENENDNGGGGDTAIQNLTIRMQNSVNVAYDYANGDQNEEEFEDAD